MRVVPCSAIYDFAAGMYESARTGDVLACITTDTAIVQTVMTSTLSMAARNVILLFGGLVMVVLSSAKMSLVVLVVVPLVILPIILAQVAHSIADRAGQPRRCAVQAEETMAAIRTVQARQAMMARASRPPSMTAWSARAACQAARLDERDHHLRLFRYCRHS